MAYWWVSQNQTYRHERDGGFLWAPNQTEAGLTPFHWSNMNLVQPGDVILSYVGARVVAVSVAKTAAYDSPRPGGMGEGLWEDRGKRVDVEYRDLAEPLAVSQVVADLQPLMPERYAPLNRFGTGNQGYLFSLPPQAGRFLLDRIDARVPGQATEAIEEGVGRAVAASTERRALVLSRIGQGRFREDVMGLWGGRCAVTGLDISPLLRASHIKPWRDSDNRERLDPLNGLLLSPSYDATFDSGLITFDENGGVILSDEWNPLRIEQVGIAPTARVEKLRDGHRPYLDYHRRNVFKGLT
jgi:putative restriction endonuclease